MKKDTVLSELENQLPNLLSRGELIQFHRGQILFYQDHEPYGIYLIRSGKIKVSSNGENCEKSQVLNSSQGEIIGLDPLIQGTPFCCTGVAETECEVIFIPKTVLLALLEQLKTDSPDKDQSSN